MPKWSVDAVDKNLADVDPDTVGSMYDPAIGVPPKGPYLCTLNFVKVGKTGENSATPGSAKIWIKAEISEPAGTKKAKYNGYELYKHQNVALASEAGRINQFLLALLDNTKLTAAKKKAVLAAFHDRQVVVDDKENITKIGTWTLPDGMKIGIVTRPDKDQNGEAGLGVGSWLPPSQAPKAVPEDEEDAEDVEEDETDADESEEPDEDEAVTERQEELEGYTLAKLKTTAKSLKIKVPRGADEETLVNLILDEEFPVEDEPEEDADEEPEEDDTEEEESDEEEDDADEEGDEYDEMDRAALRAVAKENGVKVLKSMSDDDLREAIRAAVGDEEADEEEEDEEPEPEPVAKRPARKGANPAPKGRPAANRRAAKNSSGPAVDDEPPF